MWSCDHLLLIQVELCCITVIFPFLKPKLVIDCFHVLSFLCFCHECFQRLCHIPACIFSTLLSTNPSISPGGLLTPPTFSPKLDWLLCRFAAQLGPGVFFFIILRISFASSLHWISCFLSLNLPLPLFCWSTSSGVFLRPGCTVRAFGVHFLPIWKCLCYFAAGVW